MISDLLKIKKGVTSVIGGGGKTTLLNTLANELKAKGAVIITTTTHIMKSEIFPNVVTKYGEENLSYINEQLKKHNCICLGSLSENGKLTMPDTSFSDLEKIFDYILVEADGSKRLPLKAHLDFEPVIPVESNQTILVTGVDAVGCKLSEVAHRVNKASELLGCSRDTVVTPEMVAKLINTENLHNRVVFNKCDNINLKETAGLISRDIKTECIIASLLKGEWYVSSN
ncbi:MAG: putative selenium-dependent hydroxylase accessory protein YqeC [Ruminococcus sp.]|nr:putative selenium-dependent hydroxylase accessory protein YqeC [Ruminococcus sp.]